MIRRLSCVLATAAVSLVAVTGCGGDDEAAPATSPVATTAETAPPETTTPPALSTTAPPAPTTTVNAWCGLAQHLEDTDEFLDSEVIIDPEALEAGITTWISDLTAAQPSAPEEIQSAVQTTIDVVSALDDAFAAVDYEVLDVDFGKVEGLDTDMPAAAAQIEAYNLTACGIVADDDSDDADGPGDAFDPSAGSVREQAVERFVAQGFTPEEAGCLVDQIELAPAADETEATVAAVEAFTACGITAERLLELGG